MSRLTDKARSINFDDDADSAPPAPAAAAAAAAAVAAPDRPRTAIGRLSAGFALEQENRALRERLQSFEDAKVIDFIDPKRIRPSRFANRHEQSYAGAEFQLLKDEVASAGRNVQPIKVRRLNGEDAHQFEIVFGHRRHRACLELGVPVAAVVEDLSDADLFVEMERENRARADLSPWEQGVMYKRALEEKLFPSMRNLAESIGAQVGNVSTAVQLASLPAEVVGAFDSPMALQYRFAGTLRAAFDRSPEAVLARARELAASHRKLPAKEVVAVLCGLAPGEGSSREFTMGRRRLGGWEKDAKGNISIRIKAGALAAERERDLLEYLEKVFAG